jgi:hypothetical protein
MFSPENATGVRRLFYTVKYNYLLYTNLSESIKNLPATEHNYGAPHSHEK